MLRHQANSTVGSAALYRFLFGNELQGPIRLGASAGDPVLRCAKVHVCWASPAIFASKPSQSIRKGTIASPANQPLYGISGTAAPATAATQVQVAVWPLGKQMTLEKLRRMHCGDD